MSTARQNIQGGAFDVLNDIRAKHQMFRSQPPVLSSKAFEPAKCQVICVASGKGGAGKTLVSCNIAVVLAQLGLRVTLIDADYGLANAHLMLGVSPRYDVSHVVRREKTLEDIVEAGPAGVRLIPGGSGTGELAMLSGADMEYLALQMSTIEETSDVAVVDLSAGINPQVLRFLNVAHDIVIVSDHEATARADALATVKMLAETIGAATVHVVINRARNRDHAVVSFQQLWNAVNRAWRGRINLFFSGWVPKNWYVESSVMLGKPLVLRHPLSLPAQCMKTMGAKLHKHHLSWRSRQVGRWGMPSAFARLVAMAGNGN